MRVIGWEKGSEEVRKESDRVGERRVIWWEKGVEKVRKRSERVGERGRRSDRRVIGLQEGWRG